MVPRLEYRAVSRSRACLAPVMYNVKSHKVADKAVCFALRKRRDGVEKLSTEPFSTNIGRCFGVNCFLLVAPEDSGALHFQQTDFLGLFQHHGRLLQQSSICGKARISHCIKVLRLAS